MKRDLPLDGRARRTFLRATAIVVTMAGASGPAAGTETAGTRERTSQGTPTPGPEPTPILLGGEVSHWFGLAPPPIHGEENPTLALNPGERYRLVRMNLDGVEHELIIQDADGTELVATESATRAGATRSVVFTASREMAQYYCEYHPRSIRGDVDVGAGGTNTGTPAAGTTTPDGGNGTGH